VTIDGPQVHGPFGFNCVEHRRIWIVAVPGVEADPVALHERFVRIARGMFANTPQNLVDVVTLKVDAGHNQATGDRVRVRVNEAGHQHSAIQIDCLGGCADMGGCAGVVTHVNDVLTFHSDRICGTGTGTGTGTGEDTAVTENIVSGRC
jgi:hypothetical protein